MVLELMRNTGFKEEWSPPLGEALDLGEIPKERVKSPLGNLQLAPSCLLKT